MAVVRRNLSLAALMLARTGFGGVVLSSVMATLLGLAGVVPLRGNGWRTGALFAVAMTAVSVAYTRA